MPTEIRLHQKSRVMAIVFADGPPSFHLPCEFHELGENQENLWADYLAKLKAAGASRE